MSGRKPMWLSIILLWIAVITILGVNSIQGKRIDTLENQVADLEAVQLETLTLLDQMVETDKALLNAVEGNTRAIENLTDSDGATFEAIEGLLYIIEVYREDHVESMAEIYQGHIIPLRAFHMESGD